MPARKPRLLLVDDKRANLIALEAVLGEGYDMLFAESGEEAIATLQKERDVDLILLDVQMPRRILGFERATR
jgi:CheY-like chemotaxis protein